MGFAEIVSARLVGDHDSHPPFIPPSRLAPLAGIGRHLDTNIPNEGGNGRYFQKRAPLMTPSCPATMMYFHYEGSLQGAVCSPGGLVAGGVASQQWWA
jgi:hypothetical protein